MYAEKMDVFNVNNGSFLFPDKMKMYEEILINEALKYMFTIPSTSHCNYTDDVTEIYLDLDTILINCLLIKKYMQ